MDLLERYLAAIARQLPAAQKADVTAELRDVLLSKVEEEEARVGRPLEREDLDRLLINFGHPLLVAGRYRKVQHLIGPEIFPYWWAAIKATLGVVAAIYLALAILGMMTAPGRGAHQTGPDLVTLLVFLFGAVTLVCALIERLGKTALLGRWKPRDLPPLQDRGRGRFEILIEMVLGLGMIAWWTHMISFQNYVPAIGLRVEMAKVWQDYFWPVLAYLAFEFATNGLAVARPGWVRANGGLRLARNLAGAAILLGLLRAGHWLDVTGAWPAAQQTTVAANFDLGMRVGIVACLGLFLGQFIWIVWRMRQFTIANLPLTKARA